MSIRKIWLSRRELAVESVAKKDRTAVRLCGHGERNGRLIADEHTIDLTCLVDAVGCDNLEIG